MDVMGGVFRPNSRRAVNGGVRSRRESSLSTKVFTSTERNKSPDATNQFFKFDFQSLGNPKQSIDGNRLTAILQKGNKDYGEPGFFGERFLGELRPLAAGSEIVSENLPACLNCGHVSRKQTGRQLTI